MLEIILFIFFFGLFGGFNAFYCRRK